MGRLWLVAGVLLATLSACDSKGGATDEGAGAPVALKARAPSQNSSFRVAGPAGS